MGGLDFVVGCVGKPSAGKSTFFNAATEGSSAKVGNYPFTTIKPNEGIGYFVCQCPCTHGTSSSRSAAPGTHSSTSLTVSAATASTATATGCRSVGPVAKWCEGGLLATRSSTNTVDDGGPQSLNTTTSSGGGTSTISTTTSAGDTAGRAPDAAETASTSLLRGKEGGRQRAGNTKCCPRYGRCVGGRRYVPVKLLDVAGLVPDAHAGRGLGNKFLDDLRHADVLIHIIDVSGTTNEKGEATVGYDASRDHEWLVEEIELWIFNNLWSRWSSIARKHRVVEASLATTFGQHLSGYGAPQALVDSVVAAFVKQQEQQPQRPQQKPQAIKMKTSTAARAAPSHLPTAGATATASGDSALVKMLAATMEDAHGDEKDACSANWQRDLLSWDKDRVMMLVREFVKQRFPFVLLMNKCDLASRRYLNSMDMHPCLVAALPLPVVLQGGDADRNVMRISEKFPDRPVVVCSALAECYLQRMKQQKYVWYEEGDGSFYTRQDAEDPFCMLDDEMKEKLLQLKHVDEKNAARLEKIKDMVIYRYGRTGVHEALRAAVMKLGRRVPTFPVKEWPLTSSSKRQNPYSECLLVPAGTTMKEFAGILHPAMERNFLYAEAPDGRRMKDSEPVTAANNTVRIVTDAAGT